MPLRVDGRVQPVEVRESAFRPARLRLGAERPSHADPDVAESLRFVESRAVELHEDEYAVVHPGVEPGCNLAAEEWVHPKHLSSDRDNRGRRRGQSARFGSRVRARRADAYEQAGHDDRGDAGPFH